MQASPTNAPGGAAMSVAAHVTDEVNAALAIYRPIAARINKITMATAVSSAACHNGTSQPVLLQPSTSAAACGAFQAYQPPAAQTSPPPSEELPARDGAERWPLAATGVSKELTAMLARIISNGVRRCGDNPTLALPEDVDALQLLRKTARDGELIYELAQTIQQRQHIAPAASHSSGAPAEPSENSKTIPEAPTSRPAEASSMPQPATPAGTERQAAELELGPGLEHPSTAIQQQATDEQPKDLSGTKAELQPSELQAKDGFKLGPPVATVTVQANGCSFDMDGAVGEAFSPSRLLQKDCR